MWITCNLFELGGSGISVKDIQIQKWWKSQCIDCFMHAFYEENLLCIRAFAGLKEYHREILYYSLSKKSDYLVTVI